MTTAMLKPRTKDRKGVMSGPRSLSKFGHIFIAGEVVEVDDEIAAELIGDARFEVTGFAGEAVAISETGETSTVKPKTKRALNRQIVAAGDLVSEDDESLWDDKTGLPTVAALSAQLGYDVTADEIETAYKTAPATGTPDAPGANEAPAVEETKEVAKPKGKVTIVRKPKPAAEEGKGDEASDGAGADDTSTEGSVTV